MRCPYMAKWLRVFTGDAQTAIPNPISPYAHVNYLSVRNRTYQPTHLLINKRSLCTLDYDLWPTARL
jgi:hypothetical protein